MNARERAQETIYLLTRDWTAEQLRKVAKPLPADVALAASGFAAAYLPGVADQFIDEMTKTNVSVPYELLAIARGRELAESEPI
jgi:hypothetical protein